ncbi:MAG: hypothetical protein KJ922_00080, partial [Nanoarchaeota archaeon]|nr:hypothetical protein [Nanoarchaeota archaeon]
MKLTFFMIWLIIMIPICASISMAGLGTVTVIDEGSVDGYAKRGTPLYFSVRPSIEGDSEITPNQVRLGGRQSARCSAYEGKLCRYDPGIIFSGCGPESCELQYTDALATYNWPNPFTMKLYLYKDDETLDSETTKTLVFDELSPLVDQFLIPLKIGAAPIRINYTVTDRACATCTNMCSGIKRVQLSNEEMLIKVIDLLTPAGDCTKVGFIDLNSAELGDEGSRAITLSVFDNFGNNFSMTKNVFIDRSSPSVDTLKIFNSGKEAAVVPPTATPLEFVVNVTDKDLLSVDLDLSSLGLSTVTLACAPLDDDVSQCSTIQTVTLQNSTSHLITITAKDQAGNIASIIQSKRIGVDTFSPTVTSIKTNHQDSSGQSFISLTDNVITVAIDDGADSVGFDKKNVYLDVQQIRSGRSSTQPDNCTKVASGYECYFYGIDPDTADGLKTVTLKSTSKDDANNAFASEFTASIKVDRSHPVISEIAYTPVAPTAADTLTLSFKVTAGSEITAMVNGSLFSADTFPKQASCSGASPYECSFDITGLSTEHISGSVLITVTDSAGNIALAAKTVEVFKGNYNTTPNFFRVGGVTPIPASIDKKVASQIDVALFISVNLQQIGSTPITVADMDVSCDNKYLSAEPTIINEFSSNPYISLKTNSLVSSIDNIPISCTLYMSVRDPTTVYGIREE